MKATIKPEGRNHSMPRGIYGFFSSIESLDGVEAVDSGRFISRGRVNGFEINIRSYDETQRTFRVRVASKGFISYPKIRVSADAREYVEDYIRNYGVNQTVGVGV